VPFVASSFRTPGNGAVTQALLVLVNDSLIPVYVRGLSVVMDRDTTTAQTVVAAQLRAWRTTEAVTGGTALATALVDTNDPVLLSGISVLGANASDGGTLTNLDPDAPGGSDAVAGQVLAHRMQTTATTGGQVLTDVHRPLPLGLGTFVIRPGERLAIGVAGATTASNPTTNQYVVNLIFEADSSLLPPSDLMVTPMSTTQLEVSWLPVAIATGYDLRRDNVIIATDYNPALIGGRIVYVDGGRTSATQYTYEVRSVQSAT
jgi:hypothetical protein